MSENVVKIAVLFSFSCNNKEQNTECFSHETSIEESFIFDAEFFTSHPMWERFPARKPES